MGLTVAQWADKVLDRRSGELPDRVVIADPAKASTADVGLAEAPKATTRLKTGRLPHLCESLPVGP